MGIYDIYSAKLRQVITTALSKIEIRIRLKSMRSEFWNLSFGSWILGVEIFFHGGDFKFWMSQEKCLHPEVHEWSRYIKASSYMTIRYRFLVDTRFLIGSQIFEIPYLCSENLNLHLDLAFPKYKVSHSKLDKVNWLWWGFEFDFLLI